MRHTQRFELGLVVTLGVQRVKVLNFQVGATREHGAVAEVAQVAADQSDFLCAYATPCALNHSSARLNPSSAGSLRKLGR